MKSYGVTIGMVQIAAHKITIVALHHYFVIFWTVFTSVPTTYDLQKETSYFYQLIFTAKAAELKGAVMGSLRSNC